MQNWPKALNLMKRVTCLSLVLGMLGVEARADETATLSIKNIPNVNVRMYGFIENDLINDSTQMETVGKGAEELDNPTIPKDNTYPGQHHETIMSIRNSRLGFDVTMPKTEYGLATEGIFELDFVGNQAANTLPGQVGGTQSERDFFNNPTVRVRHAYVNLTYNDMWNAKIGQTWSLLGWQPYYFPSEAIVQPAVGQLYRRFAQARVTNTQNLMGGDWTLESAIDAAKPAELGSGETEDHAGLRLASTKYKAVSGIGSSTPMVGMSIAASAALIPIRASGTPLVGAQPDATPDANGTVVALDVLIPIIPSSDGKNTSNTLSLTGEYSNGRGYGGLEVANASGGIGAVTDGVIGTSGVGAIDSGLAGVSHGNLDLIHLQTYRSNLTYMWPGSHFANSIGFADTDVLNMGDYAAAAAGSGEILKYQYFYGNVMYLPLTWLRFALEWSQFKDTYNDPTNRYAYDNRIQFTTYLTF